MVRESRVRVFFNQFLPKNLKPALTTRPTTSRSQSTMATDPIRVFYERNIEYFTEIAEKAIDELESKERAEQASSSAGETSSEPERPRKRVRRDSSPCELSKEAPDPNTFYPEILTSEVIWMLTEGDVTYNSAWLLIKPVTSEFRKTLPPGYNVLVKAQKRKDKSVFDFTWDLFQDDPDYTEPIRLVILELKSIGTLQWDDFSPAEVSAGDREDYEKKVKYLSDNGATFLEGEAATISRQVNKYAQYANFVLLFDWITMIIFSYEDRYKVGSNTTVHGTVSEETPEAHHITFRKLLLAVLKKAFDDRRRK